MDEPTFLTVADLATRWRCSRNTLGRKWRDGKIPAPFNSDQAQGWLWSLDVIQAYERGEWVRPMSDVETLVALFRLRGKLCPSCLERLRSEVVDRPDEFDVRHLTVIGAVAHGASVDLPALPPHQESPS